MMFCFRKYPHFTPANASCKATIGWKLLNQQLSLLIFGWFLIKLSKNCSADTHKTKSFQDCRGGFHIRPHININLINQKQLYRRAGGLLPPIIFQYSKSFDCLHNRNIVGASCARPLVATNSFLREGQPLPYGMVVYCHCGARFV